ncbi:hypothetical protein, partial [Kineococcus glutinatus]|uniref:hypothetical protein n=1 Tax=Kineococcus glutinatus TaxID=1070872 RepID=UPI0031ED2208
MRQHRTHQPSTTAYLVGSVVTSGADGAPLRSARDGAPVCHVEQGGTWVELHAQTVGELRCMARGLAVAEFREQLGEDADALLGYLRDTGLVVVDPVADAAVLTRLRLEAELADLGPAGDDARRLVRGAGGVLLVVSASTLRVVDGARGSDLATAARAVAGETGAEQ